MAFPWPSLIRRTTDGREVSSEIPAKTRRAAGSGTERSSPDSVRAAKVRGDGREVGDGPGERVEEAHGVARLVAQEQEALGAGLEVVTGELREVDAGAGTGGEVEEAAAVAVGAVEQHDPTARAEAGVQ